MQTVSESLSINRGTFCPSQHYYECHERRSTTTHCTMGYDVEARPHVSHHPRGGHVPSTPLKTIQKNKAKSWTIGIWRIYPGWPPPIVGRIINSWANPKWNNLYSYVKSSIWGDSMVRKSKVMHRGDGRNFLYLSMRKNHDRWKTTLLVVVPWTIGQSQLSMAAFRDLSWYPMRLNEDMIRQITGSDGW